MVDNMANKTTISETTNENNVRVLTLNNGEHHDGIIYRVKKGIIYYLIFIL